MAKNPSGYTNETVTEKVASTRARIEAWKVSAAAALAVAAESFSDFRIELNGKDPDQLARLVVKNFKNVTVTIEYSGECGCRLVVKPTEKNVDTYTAAVLAASNDTLRTEYQNQAKPRTEVTLDNMESVKVTWPTPGEVRAFVTGYTSCYVEVTELKRELEESKRFRGMPFHPAMMFGPRW